MARRMLVRRSFTGHRIGESHPRARLSDEDVRLIRALNEEPGKLGYKAIANKWEPPLPQSTVRNICTGRTRYDA